MGKLGEHTHKWEKHRTLAEVKVCPGNCRVLGLLNEEGAVLPIVCFMCSRHATSFKNGHYSCRLHNNRG